MAQALVVVCDVCGSPAVETVGIRVAARGYQKDVCQTHLDELVTGARAPRRGRPRSKAEAVVASRTLAKRTDSAKRKSTKKAVGRPRKKAS